MSNLRKPVRIHPAAIGLVLAAAASLLAPTATRTRSAEASVPAGVPAFTSPLEVANPYFPCVPGAFKVYSGRDGRRAVTVVEIHLPDTRLFPWNGQDVPCRTLRESKFIGGALTDASLRYFAQADDGSVWFFGEVPALGEVDEGDGSDGLDTEDDGWVVGSLAPGDPPGTASSPGPFLFMPAAPAVGDTWKPEDLADVVDETDLVVRTGVRMRLPAGRFADCLEVVERSAFSPGRETKWYAPGVGLIRGDSRSDQIRLRATTLRRR